MTIMTTPATIARLLFASAISSPLRPWDREARRQALHSRRKAQHIAGVEAVKYADCGLGK
jgi:hypothetical protein